MKYIESAFLMFIKQLASCLWSAESSSNGVWGGAPDANNFSAFQNFKKEAFGAI